MLTYTVIHTYTFFSPSLLIYAAFNVFFIVYFTSSWILFLGSRVIELVNTVNVALDDGDIFIAVIMYEHTHIYEHSNTQSYTLKVYLKIRKIHQTVAQITMTTSFNILAF